MAPTQRTLPPVARTSLPLRPLRPTTRYSDFRGRSRRRGRIARGMTLIEIMIVVAIIAMISGAIAVGAMRHMLEARMTTAETDARTIRQAARGYALLKESDGCPTLDALTADGYLDDGAKAEDPWGTPYAIQCENADLVVISAGPDRLIGGGAEDDIAIPKARARHRGGEPGPAR